MADRGIDLNDPDKVRAFAVETINGFKADLSAHVRAINPATIFYNAGHVGPCTRPARALTLTSKSKACRQAAGAICTFRLRPSMPGS